MNTPSNSLEYFDRLLNNYKWELLSSSSKISDNNKAILERSSHTINLVDKKIYVFGGENKPRTPIDNYMLVFDLAANKWETIEPDGSSIPCARLGHSSCVLNENIYLFGGRTGVDMGDASLNDLFVYSTKTNEWNQIRQEEPDQIWPPKRSYHTMAALKNKVYLFGGCSVNRGRLNDLYEYDIDEKRWTLLNTDEQILPRGGSCLVSYESKDESIESSCLYLMGGFCGKELDDCFKYDIKANKWYPVENLPRKLSVFACSSVNDKSPDNKIRVILHGGEVDPSTIGHNGAGEFSNDTYIFDGEHWYMLNNESTLKPNSRGWHSSAYGFNGKFFIFGGNLEDNERNNELWSLSFE